MPDDVPTTTDPIVISIPAPGNPPGPQPEREVPMDPTIKHVLDQGFAANSQVLLQGAARHSAGNDNVAEQTRIGFLLERMQVGTREAAATQRLDDNKLAENILAQRSASNQPATAGTPKAP